MPVEHKTHTVTAEQIGRVDLVVKAITGKSRSEVRGMCSQHCVQINDQPITDPAAPVAEGDRIDVRFDPNCRYRERWLEKFQCRSFNVVFEDDYLIVVEKQAGILTVPTEQHEGKTLVDEVSRYLGSRRRALVVHRLDRETSGLVVMAKRSDIASALQEQLRLRAPEREYLALVAGTMNQKSGSFESYLATSKRLSRYSVGNPDGGEHAITHFEVDQVLTDTTLVRVKLDTGRRNQIRVHLAEAGHPIIGDRRYRPQLSRHPDWPHTRLALHAHVLGFQHPISGEELRFVSEMPRSFETFIKQQRLLAREQKRLADETASLKATKLAEEPEKRSRKEKRKAPRKN